MVKLSEQNHYFMVATHHFTISMIISPYIMTEQKTKGYPVIRTIKTFEYENTRSDF